MTAKKIKEAPKKKTTKRTTYNWAKMQVEYFKSDIPTVAPFLKEKYGLDISSNGAVGRRVKGWQDQKTELRRESVEKAKEKIIDLYTPTAEELAQMHNGVITLFKATLQNELAQVIGTDPKTGKQKVLRSTDVATMERIWRIIKAEKLEPTAVQKNENSISAEDRDILAQLLDQNYIEDEDEV